MLSYKTPPAGFKWFACLVSCGRRNLLLLVLSCIAIAAPFPAGGYTLQGPHVLELMVQTLSGAQTLRVVQQVIVEDSSIADHPLEVKETLFYSFPEKFRSDGWFENTHRIHVAVSNEMVTIVDGRRTSDAATPFDRYKDLLLHRSRKLLYKKLLSHGVDVEKTSLGRFGERIVYVLGAQYPDESVSQLMVDKESFLPMRWLNVLSADPEERLEFIYGDWQKKGDVWYPMQIESYYNRRLIRRTRLLDIEVNAKLSAEIFDMAHLRSAYPLADQVIPPSPPSSSDEVQRTIEEFQKKFSD
ncbi:MAG: hypothetical protein C4519_26265 [Desulfobacteraceae bacterium]|nr:MAG: hypothetical protein C4519_26265 [Desulfobacteraceae bacterium]